jgi:hypothetical protein
MSKYYVNANPTGEPDGLTPETGFVNVSALIDVIDLVDDDIIEIVSNGDVDEGEDTPVFSTRVTIQKYEGSISRPNWRILQLSFNASFSFYDLDMDRNSIAVDLGTAAGIALPDGDSSVVVNVERNKINNIFFFLGGS